MNLPMYLTTVSLETTISGFLSNVLLYRIYYYYFNMKAIHKIFLSHHDYYFMRHFFVKL